jgi:lipopolysaccharide biosynthesis glycosyltransferase
MKTLTFSISYYFSISSEIKFNEHMVKRIKIRGRPPKAKTQLLHIPGRRRPWTTLEDETITKLVHDNGTQQWAVIADKLNKTLKFSGRSGKQCRERWHNHLDPHINKDPWSLDEEKLLFEKHLELGNKWADISKIIKGRTDNAIKNHFYSSLRRQFRKVNGFDGSREQIRELDEVLSLAILNQVNKKMKNRRQTRVESGEEEEEEDESSDYGLRPLEELIITGNGIDIPETGYYCPDEIFVFPCEFNL